MLDKLIERLALQLAQAKYWKINSDDETEKVSKSRLKQARKIAELCLQEIEDFLHEENLNFDDLGIDERRTLSRFFDQSDP
ncbi:hypothetical protein PN499_22030 [Kamptonema animale CS-326]|jgi:hypothetical protein|uniref:hypothetical protein n=1 Tax=Kamptonema animale TaxID=92934 RepID=UPI00232E2131|nr:hypothetical protein [Kamptonema animale]MDB9513882.1 hypothetical protein [Kamptonema animale CS-326]